MSYRTDNNLISRRIFVSSEENIFLQRASLRYGLSRESYLEACVKDVVGRERMVVVPFTGKRTIAAYFNVPQDVWEKAQGDAESMGMKVMAIYLRQRMLGGLSYEPPRIGGLRRRGVTILEQHDAVMGLPSRRGRPRKSDYMMELCQNPAFGSLLLNVGAMSDFIENVFTTVAGCGIDPGDVETLLEYLSCLVSSSVTMISASTSDVARNPRTIQAATATRRFEAWSSLHGRVVVEPAPPSERRADFKTSMRMMRRT